MRLGDYGSVSVAVRPTHVYTTPEVRNLSLDLITPCKATNAQFLAGYLYNHNHIAATISIAKHSSVTIVNINPYYSYFGVSYLTHSSKRIIHAIKYPERMQALERIINKIRRVNKQDGPWKMRIKFNNVVAQWMSQKQNNETR